MFSYIIVFYLFFIFAVMQEHNILKINSQKIKYIKYFVIIFLSLYIGFRDEVGGDWGTYKESYFLDKIGMDLYYFLNNFIFSKDFLFQFLNWFSASIYPSYHLLNFFSAIIFSFCLVYFCFNLKRPFLGLLISTSYLITVVAMGYHRQALAIAFFMVGLIQIEKNKILNYYILIFVSFLFHYTSIILFFFGILSQKKIKIFPILIIIFVGGFLSYYVIGMTTISSLLRHYIQNDYAASGALPRILMCLVPALIYIFFYSFIKKHFINNFLMISFSTFTIILFLMLVVFHNSSAFVDRLAIYLIPFQILFFDKFIDFFKYSNNSNFVIFYLTILFYLMVLIVWCFFGSHHLWWFPYKNVLINY